MTWFANLRLLALVRRMARALERLATAAETQARIAEDTWKRANVRPHPRPIEISTLDIAESNRLWRDAHREHLEPATEEEAEEA